jgi:glycosyltransferase involved in cell wall biosynthesis
MNVLHVMPYIPFPTSGAPVRDYNIIRNLSFMGIESQLICNYDHLQGETENIEFLENKLGANIHSVKVPDLPVGQKIECVLFKRMYPPIIRFDSSKNRAFIASVLQNGSFDIIHAQHSLEAAPTLRATQSINFDGLKLLTLHNVDHLNLRRQRDLHKSPFMKFAYNRVFLGYKEHELDIINEFDHIFVVSEKDKNIYVSEGIPKSKIDVIPNGVDCNTYNPEALSSCEFSLMHPNLLFMGKLSYLPNAYGIKAYLQHVHPIIKKEIPEIKLYIVGRDCPKWLRIYAEKDSSVEIIGFVDDVRPYILEADICIAPLTAGSGTRLKILEYMAMSRPVVSTSIGAEGLDIDNEKNIIIADKWDIFAERIIFLINNETFAKKLGFKARQLVENNYDWKKIVEKQSTLYKLFLSNFISR